MKYKFSHVLSGFSRDLMSAFNGIINVSLSIIKAIEFREENELAPGKAITHN